MKYSKNYIGVSKFSVYLRTANDSMSTKELLDFSEDVISEIENRLNLNLEDKFKLNILLSEYNSDYSLKDDGYAEVHVLVLAQFPVSCGQHVSASKDFDEVIGLLPEKICLLGNCIDISYQFYSNEHML